jgi:hypothetical protein
MRKRCPPVALVQTWLSILQEHNSKLNYGKRRAANAIETIFGSVEIAAISIVNTR